MPPYKSDAHGRSIHTTKALSQLAGEGMQRSIEILTRSAAAPNSAQHSIEIYVCCDRNARRSPREHGDARQYAGGGEEARQAGAIVCEQASRTHIAHAEPIC